MIHWLSFMAFAWLPVAGIGESGDAVVKAPVQMNAPPKADAAPARDGNIAIREEFAAALQQRTVDALQHFIARHPKHELAAEAMREVDKLKAARPR